MSTLEQSYWPLDSVDTALMALADAHRMGVVSEADHGQAPPTTVDAQRLEHELGRWLDLRAGAIGAEIESVSVEISQLEPSLRRLGPALLLVELPGTGDPVLLAVDARGRLLGPDLVRRRFDRRELAGVLAEPLVAPVRRECEQLLEAACVPKRRREGARDALIRRRIGTEPVGGIWQLRHPPHTNLGKQLVEEGAAHSSLLLVTTHLAHYVLLLAAWWLIGRGVLEGRNDLGWLVAWALLVASLVPLQAAQVWHGGLLALRLGSVLKRRMLAGALALDPDELRDRGMGRLLAMVIEAEAVEGLALSSGLLAATAVVDLMAAAWVLSRGAGAYGMLGMLAVSGVIVLLLGLRYAATRRVWTRERLGMTHTLVERMVGHTTRLAQQAPEHWHDHEDASTAAYVRRSSHVDRISIALAVFARRGWMLVGVIGLWPALVGSDSTTATLAVAFGGMLLAGTGFTNLAAGVTDLIDLSVAWREVSPLVRAGSHPQRPPRYLRPAPASEPNDSTEPRARPVIEARELVHRYPGRERPTLRSVDLEVSAGERLLLEGPSGGGKSTLAAVLAGLRRPAAGLLLLDGLDAPTHGEQGWRERVAAAPQFHQNHVLTNTFAFNLLMGRHWPPSNDDLRLAKGLCVELGLGPLLERMPAGMQQNVGETGWQLSHGERSRVFLARVLLQGAEVVILDESFAALDPDNQALALRCVFHHASTLLVIAHP